MISKRSIFLATIISTLPFCFAQQKKSLNKPHKKVEAKKLPPSTTPSGTFSSLTVIGNQNIGSNLAVGNNISANSIVARETAQVGKENCHNGSLMVNGNATITDSVQVGSQISTQHINTNTLVSNTQDSTLITAQAIKTDCLNVLDNANVGGILYANEIDPFSGTATTFSSDVIINNTKKLLVNEINPGKKVACNNSCGNQFEMDDTLTTSFSGNVFIARDLSFPESIPADGLIKVFDNKKAFHTFIHNYGIDGINDGNTFSGIDAGSLVTPGAHNTILGYQSGEDNINDAGNSNRDNTQVGTLSMNENIDGSYNTALGAHTLQNNDSGNDNVAVGYSALRYSQHGRANTAIGSECMENCDYGDYNTALGFSSMEDSDYCNYNTALGAFSMQNCDYSDFNTAVGAFSLQHSNGDYNAAIGFLAGNSLNSGDNNIYIRNQGDNFESNTIRIGNDNHDACYIAGIYNNPAAYSSIVVIDTDGHLGVSGFGLSSRRYKKDINDMNEASAQLMKLRPVTFKFKNQPENAPLEYGLIAEEVAEVLPELVVFNKDGQPDSVKYHVLPALLLNEYQQQQKTINNLDEKVDQIINQLENLELNDKQLDQLIEKIIQRDEVKNMMKRLNQLEQSTPKRK